MNSPPPIPQAPQLGPKPTEPREGNYKARAVAPDAAGAPHEFGRSKSGVPELLVHMFLPDLGKTYVSPLYFSTGAATYSEERLRSLGCRDIVTLAGIDSNEVIVSLSYESFEGKWRLRVQILSGSGVFHSSDPITGKEFDALLKTTLGRSALSGGGSTNGSKPPF